MKPKILIIGGGEHDRENIQGLLKFSGYENIITSGNGREAEELLFKDNSIGVLIVDWNMPTSAMTWAINKAQKLPIPVLAIINSEKERRNAESMKIELILDKDSLSELFKNISVSDSAQEAADNLIRQIKTRIRVPAGLSLIPGETEFEG